MKFRDTLPRQAWKQEMSEKLTKKICDAKSFFTNCYQVSSGKCQRQMPDLLKDCFPNRMPSTIDLHTDGIIFGSALGRCAGLKFHERNIDEYKSNAECKSPEKWKKDI